MWHHQYQKYKSMSNITTRISYTMIPKYIKSQDCIIQNFLISCSKLNHLLSILSSSYIILLPLFTILTAISTQPSTTCTNKTFDNSDLFTLYVLLYIKNCRITFLTFIQFPIICWRTKNQVCTVLAWHNTTLHVPNFGSGSSCSLFSIILSNTKT